MKTSVIIGSTGLIGSQLVNLLLESSQYDKVIAFVKRDSEINNPKFVQYIIDFDNPLSYKDLITGDDFFCTIGTTIKTAGSKEALRKVDFEYPTQFAEMALKNNVKQFLIISSLGATELKGNFYLKTKGEMENHLSKMNFESISILRPSLLLGERKEFRFDEKIASFYMKLFGFLFIGNLKKCKAIESKIVAKALFQIAQKNNKGFTIYESDAIQKMAE